MPGLTTPLGHSQSQSALEIAFHPDAADFLHATYPTLARHEASANIILAHALGLMEQQHSAPADCRQSDAPGSSSSSQRSSPFWLTVWSTPASSNTPHLDVVLASVSNLLGDYPIFLWSPRALQHLTSSWLRPRMHALAEHLSDTVPASRVFSVFGMTTLVKAFTREWAARTHVPVEPEPFYSAYYTFCTRHTFRDVDVRLPKGHEIRRAVDLDLDGVAQLCKEFADDSVYFPLPLERARLQACELIAKGLIWIYDVDGEVTAICAVTRSSHNVSAITKVFTTPKWRRRGFAEHLVRHVTRLLLSSGKSSVTLYVGHSNSAQTVYDRVGFAGLCGNDKPPGVEDALEIGFATGSARGHW